MNHIQKRQRIWNRKRNIQDDLKDYGIDKDETEDAYYEEMKQNITKVVVAIPQMVIIINDHNFPKLN